MLVDQLYVPWDMASHTTPLPTHRGILPDARSEITRDEAVKGIMDGRDLATPQKDCPASCNGRGMCRRNPKAADQPATCMCYWGWQGTDCSQVRALQACCSGSAAHSRWPAVCMSTCWCHVAAVQARAELE